MTDRDRNRSLNACTGYLLKLLCMLDHVEIYTAAAAWKVNVNTVHQAACRLRKAGLPVQTKPPGPFNQWSGGADYYFITNDWLDYANILQEIWSGDLRRAGAADPARQIRPSMAWMADTDDNEVSE